MSRSSRAAVRTSALTLSLLMLAACAPSLKVESDFSQSSNFTQYRTYAFADIPSQAASKNSLDPLLTERVRASLDASLPARGLQKASNPAEADLLVYAWGSSKERMDVQDWGTGYTDGGYRWGGTYASNTSVTYYNQGTLVVDMIDPKKKQLVWRGTASGTVQDRTEAQQKIPEAVTEIAKKYPPTPGSS